MLNIQRFVFNPYQENTYVVSDESGECVINYIYLQALNYLFYLTNLKHL